MQAQPETTNPVHQDGIQIKVYTSESCQPCRITKKTLSQRNLPYIEIDANEHSELLREAGFRELPVVIVERRKGEMTEPVMGIEPWSGFRPDLIDSLAKKIGPALRAQSEAQVTTQSVEQVIPAKPPASPVVETQAEKRKTNIHGFTL